MLIDRPSLIDHLRSFEGVDIIRVLTGVRRAGKSTLLEIYRKGLEETDPGSTLILRIDGPDFLFDKSPEHLVDSINEKITEKTRFIFLDEIQLIEDWQKVVSGFYSLKKYEIIITGSNSYMMSGELATLLTGRYVQIEVLPLSFREYSSAFPNKDKAELFESYLETGGFPAVALSGDVSQKKDLLAAIRDSILLNDVGRRLGGEVNTGLLFRLVSFLNDSAGFPVSQNKLTNTLRSAGFKMYYELTARYIEALKDSCLFYACPFCDTRGGERFSQLQKFYPVDPGLMNLTRSNLAQNYSSLLETVVYSELRRRRWSVNAGRAKAGEIDFVVRKHDRIMYIQVTSSLLNDETREREFRSLEAIKDNWPKLVLSMDIHDFSRGGIIHKNIIDFLLDEDG